jgi:hypothetical protein
MSISDVKLFGIAGWRLVPKEPRHNTWHNALYIAAKKLGVNLEYLGLVNTYKMTWIQQIFPDSILRRFPYLNIVSFIKIIKKVRSSRGKSNIIYIFEGSFFWIFVLTCISVFVPNCTVICNLFSSGRYNQRFFRNKKLRLWYAIVFKLIEKNQSLIVTFDTQLMTSKLNKSSGLNLIRFPVPSSFPYNRRDSMGAGVHYRVLVNLRSFQLEGLHFLLQNACQECTFVFPRGPLATIPLQIEFGKYGNTSFDENVIPVSEYEKYIDSFDYMIFLYEPSIDASGRILDSITRGLPLCVPRQSTEWAFIAKTWGHSSLFDWNSLEDISRTFNHPVFENPRVGEEPPFTPEGSLLELLEIGSRIESPKKKYGLITKTFVFSTMLVHSVLFAFMSYSYSLIMRAKSMFSR